MSFSKSPLNPVLLTAAICLPLGYLVAMVFEEPSHESPSENKHAQSSRGIEQTQERVIARVAEDPDSRLGMLTRIAEAGIDDLPELRQEIFSQQDGNSFSLQKVLFDRWIELDAQKGWAFLLEEKRKAEGKEVGNIAYSYFGRWSLADPDSALAVAGEIADNKMKESARSSIAWMLSSHRPADYFRALIGPEGKEFAYGRATAARMFGISDPQGAVATIGNLNLSELGIEGPPLSADLASGWAKNDPDAALAWVREIAGKEEKGRALRAIAKRLIDVDGERAAALFKEADQLGKAASNNGRDRDIMRYNWEKAAELLGNTDPAAAMAWVSKHYPESSARMIPDFLPQDGVAAVDALAALPEAALKDGKLSEWPDKDWRPHDLEAAMERASALPDSEKSDSIRAWILSAMATSDPQAALVGAERDLSDPANRAHILTHGTEKWARIDVTAAGEWLAARESGTETDAAIGGFLNVAKYLEPEAAFQWAAVVSDPAMRLIQLKSVYATMRETSGEELARAALADAPLSESEVESITGGNSTN